MIKELTIENTRIPEGWCSDKLDTLCDVEYGTRVVRKRDGGTIYPVYGGGGATFFMDTFNRKNCLVVARFAMSEKCTRFINGKFFLNDSGLSVKPKDTDIVSQEFLNKYFIFLNDYIYSLARGAAQKNLNVPAFRKIEILYPESLTKQRQIVATLDKAFTAIDRVNANVEENLQNTKELFESYLQNVFKNKGDDWEEKTIGDIGKPSMCKRILKQQTSSDGDIPFYKIGTFGKVPNAYISKELYEEYKSKYSFPKKGDVLISASGTIGRRVIYDGEPAFFQDSNIVWINNDEKQVLNKFLYIFYGFCDWQPSKGATISRLYNANLKSIKITFPKLLQEQQRVIQKIEVISKETKKLESIYKQKLVDLQEMKKSILQKAFSGQLKNVS